MTGWQTNRENNNKNKKKAAFVKTFLRECRVITIIIVVVKWLLHFSFVLADRRVAEVPWCPLGAPAEELSSCIQWWTPGMTAGSTSEAVRSCSQASPGACRLAQ